MSLATEDLPQDPEQLRTFAVMLQKELYSKTLYIETLRAQLGALRRARHGQSSEKLDSQIDMLELMIGELEETQAEHELREEAKASEAPADAAAAQKRKRSGGPRTSNRSPLPEHLPREEVPHPAACVCPACGSTRMTKITDERREVLEYVPSHFKVIAHLRPKMSCRDCEAITQPPMPSLPIERGRPGPRLIAHVAIAKYCDHLPLYRQSEIFARQGVELDRSTLADWIGRAAVLVTPLYELVGRYARGGGACHADDTPIPVLEPGRGCTRTGRLWVVVRDEQPWGSQAPRAAFYCYSPDRKGERAHALLEPCRGYLHADAYAGYGALYKPDPITGQVRLVEVACWAHARRGIFEEHARTKSPLARQILKRIGDLFAVEREINGHSAETRLAVRKAKSVPLLAELKAFFEAALEKISRKGALAVAIRYCLTRWDALCRFTEDGRLEMTNNAAERAIKPLTLGRKNWMFLGSDTGGDRAAVFFTLIQTCKLNGVDPESYLADIVGRINDHPAKKIDDLLPWNWRPPNEPASIAA